MMAVTSERRLRYSVLYSDAQGVTHFRDDYLVWNEAKANGESHTPLLDAQKIGFLRLNREFSEDSHPAPSKRFVMVLTGIMEVVAGDGESRRFEAGSVLLVSDTSGSGHRTNVIGEDDAFLVWVPVP